MLLYRLQILGSQDSTNAKGVLVLQARYSISRDTQRCHKKQGMQGHHRPSWRSVVNKKHVKET